MLLKRYLPCCRIPDWCSVIHRLELKPDSEQKVGENIRRPAILQNCLLCYVHTPSRLSVLVSLETAKKEILRCIKWRYVIFCYTLYFFKTILKFCC